MRLAQVHDMISKVLEGHRTPIQQLKVSCQMPVPEKLRKRYCSASLIF